MAVTRIRAGDAAVALWPAVVLIALGALGFGAVLDWVLEQEDLFTLDQPLVEWLAEQRTPALTQVMTTVSLIFGPVVLPVLVAVIALVWWRVARSWWHPLLMVGAMLLSTLLTVVLKAVVGRARPGEDLMAVPGLETSGSFPSGHTIGAATLVLVVGYLLWHEDAEASWQLVVWVLASALIILAVAFSRMYLGYHFLTDVVAGGCVAVAVLGVVVGIERWHDLALERRDPPPRPTPLADEVERELWDDQDRAETGEQEVLDVAVEPLPWRTGEQPEGEGDEERDGA